jgi:hypothetical protein
MEDRNKIPARQRLRDNFDWASCDWGSARGSFCDSIDYESGGAVFGVRAVWRAVVVCYVIAHARGQGVTLAVLMLDGEIACDQEDDVAFGTPMVGQVAWAVLDATKLNFAELAGADCCRSGRAGM